MSRIILQPAQVPQDTPLPANAQQLINFIAASLLPLGLEGLEGVVLSSAEPAPEDRDKVWVKKDVANGRVIGLFTYDGGWVQVPVTLGAGENKPGGPKAGEFFFNTTFNALEIFNGTQWTTNLFRSGSTSSRPTDVPVNYLYFDTDISRLLRYTSRGWTTNDGFVGQIVMAGALSETDALARNPGWEIYEDLADRFPIGKGSVAAAGDVGGKQTVAWSAAIASAHGGSREQGLITSLTIDGDAVKGAANGSGTTNHEMDILPPYRGMLYLRKAY